MLALKYSLRVVGVEMSKHNAKVAAKRAKVALKTVSKQKKQMGLLWRRAYEMCRRHRMRRAFRAWRGPRDCDHCCPPPRRRRNEKKTKKSVTSWIKNEDSGGVRSVRISFLLHLLRLLTCITYKTRNSDSCHFLLVSPTRNITTRMLRNTYLALRARTQLEHRYPYSSDPIRLLRIYGTSWVHIVVMIVLFLWDCIHVVISPVHFYDFLKEEDSRECVLCPVAIIF